MKTLVFATQVVLLCFEVCAVAPALAETPPLPVYSVVVENPALGDCMNSFSVTYRGHVAGMPPSGVEKLYLLPVVHTKGGFFEQNPVPLVFSQGSANWTASVGLGDATHFEPTGSVSLFVVDYPNYLAAAKKFASNRATPPEQAFAWKPNALLDVSIAMCPP